MLKKKSTGVYKETGYPFIQYLINLKYVQNSKAKNDQFLISLKIRYKVMCGYLIMQFWYNIKTSRKNDNIQTFVYFESIGTRFWLLFGSCMCSIIETYSLFILILVSLVESYFWLLMVETFRFI